MCRDRDADGDAQTGDLGTSGSGLEERLVYLLDANYNVTALLREFVGYWVVCERYSYDPYGQVTVLHGGEGYDSEVDGVTIFEWQPKSANPDGSPCVSRYDNEILYCGYRFDWETGLYNVRHRVYHPTLGRWTRRDPAGYVDKTNSFISYVSFRPLNLRDPMGLQSSREEYEIQEEEGRKSREQQRLNEVYDNLEVVRFKNCDLGQKEHLYKAFLATKQKLQAFKGQYSSQKLLEKQGMSSDDADAVVKAQKKIYDKIEEMRQYIKNGKPLWLECSCCKRSFWDRRTWFNSRDPEGQAYYHSSTPRTIVFCPPFFDAKNSDAKRADTFAHEFGHVVGLKHLEDMVLLEELLLGADFVPVLLNAENVLTETVQEFNNTLAPKYAEEVETEDGETYQKWKFFDHGKGLASPER